MIPYPGYQRLFSRALTTTFCLVIFRGIPMKCWLNFAKFQSMSILACEQALLFGRASRERASEGPLPLPLAASPLARAFSQDSLRSPK